MLQRISTIFLLNRAKKIFLICGFLILSISSYSQTKPDTAIIKFQQQVISDTVSASATRLKYYFVFTNTGTIPLIIQHAKGSDPDFPFYYPKNPVWPGGIDSIGVVLIPQQLKIANLNRQYKVYYNKDQEITLYLKRRVIN